MICIGLCVWWGGGYDDKIFYKNLRQMRALRARWRAKPAHVSRICYKNIFIKSEDLRIWEFWGKGIDLDTPKKYTFALVEVKWVFKYRDFSKIAVLFLCILFFCVFCNKKWSILRHFSMIFCVVLCCVVLCCDRLHKNIHKYII